ncbi:MAG: DUF2335 domain-containing protein [Nitrospira sp.]|jgi:uncharacterized membrane protein|nr:DUF2335 domain-containing protein [Nitrospira sp.]
MPQNENLPDRTPPQQDELAPASSKVVTSSHKTTLAFSGPLPPPNILAGYNNIVPGAAERIIAIAEGEASHQRGMEQLAVQRTFDERRLGQIFGFLMGVMGLSVAAFLAHYGHEVTASVIGGTTVVGLVTVFVFGRSTKDSS